MEGSVLRLQDMEDKEYRKLSGGKVRIKENNACKAVLEKLF